MEDECAVKGCGMCGEGVGDECAVKGCGMCGEGVEDECAVKGCGMCVLTAEFVYRVRQVMLVRMAKLVPPAPRGRWE